MGIEPISSMMTVQAQGGVVQVQRTQTPVQAERPESADSSVQMAEQVDHTTNVVENAREKGQAESGEQQGKGQQPTNEQIRKAVEQLNKKIGNSEAIFGIHEATNRVTIKIVDKESKEVIKELPPEKTLDMIAKIWDMAGILVDEKR